MALLSYPFNQRLADLDSGRSKIPGQYIINTKSAKAAKPSMSKHPSKRHHFGTRRKVGTQS
jgi:hypothetical protein